MWSEEDKKRAINHYMKTQDFEKSAKFIGCSQSSLRSWWKNGWTQPKASKECNAYCVKQFLPERNRVEREWAKKTGVKYSRPSSDIVNAYVTTCESIYCRKKQCADPQKPLWAPTIKEKRKMELIAKGAVSGCRDLVKEFGAAYYKNNV